MGVPLLDFADWRAGGGARNQLVADLGGALERYGFVALTGHGVAPEQLAQAYRAAERVFALPDATKRGYETPEDGRQRGYTSFRIEHARDQPLADLKEFWHVGRVETALPGVPENRFPQEVPEFETCFSALFSALDHFSHAILRVAATYLDLPEDWFVERVRGGNSLLRAIHYPPLGHEALGDEAPDGAVRAAAHEDVNLLTVLPASTAPGLEILTREGHWLPVQPPAGAMICDTGDMMHLLTAGRLPATTHRVVNPAGPGASSSRYALPFFVHPRPEVELSAIDGSAVGPTAAEFLMARLTEIGLTPGPSSDGRPTDAI